MANPKHVERLRDVDAWNAWRRASPDEVPDLREASLPAGQLYDVDLSRADLSRAELSSAALSGANLSFADVREASLRMAHVREANLRGAYLYLADLSDADLDDADLYGAQLFEADLHQANLREADLRKAYLNEAKLVEANLHKADLSGADLSGADLSAAVLSEAVLAGANLQGANLSRADLTGANLTDANLSTATLVGTTLTDADLSSTRVYGVSAWGIEGTPLRQTGLIITPHTESSVTVENLKVAQFVYLLLSNPEIRDVIDTVAKKAVLVLGRFTDERMRVLEAVHEALRARDYVPIIFNFDKPEAHDLAETVTTLAHLSRFIVADLSDPASIPAELQAIVPHLAVPVAPIILSGRTENALVKSLAKYPWFLKTRQYDSEEHLIDTVLRQLVEAAEREAETWALFKSSSDGSLWRASAPQASQ